MVENEQKLCDEVLSDELRRLKESCSVSSTVLGAVVKAGATKETEDVMLALQRLSTW